MALEIASGETTLSLQVFASSTPGRWNSVRSQMRDDLVRDAGTAVELDGLGRELWGQYPRTSTLRHGEIQQSRIIGHDGPGWLLRGSFTWHGRWVPEDFAALERIYSDVIVVRGQDELPDRARLPISKP